MTQRTLYEDLKEQIVQSLETLQRGEFTLNNFRNIQAKARSLYEKSKSLDYDENYDPTFWGDFEEVQQYAKFFTEFADSVMNAGAVMAFLRMDMGLSEIEGEEE